ncbi:MAG: DUF1934 domain-containing protein [Oscillospiraceae bacterium]|nr:DUF1934 domain-containing protein [Oscillospiraceae bacterium]
MKDVMITIVNSMLVDKNEKPDVTEVITEGKLEMTETGCVLSYDLDPEDGDQPNDSHTDMILEGNTFDFIRTGMYGADFLVEPGVRNQTLYRMPFGSMTVGVLGKELKSDISEDKGSITAKYDIDFSSALVAGYVMKISYRTI